MKHRIDIIVTVFIVLLSADLFAQQTYTCTIKNQRAVVNDFIYDIYMQRTGPDEIYLGPSEFSVTFNAINFDTPTVSRVAGPSLSFYQTSVALLSDSIVKFTVGTLLFNDQSEFDSRVCKPSTTDSVTLIATVTISGINNTSGYAGILWRLKAPHNSKVYTYQPADPWNLTEITGTGQYPAPPNAILPVELASFTARAIRDEVELKWETSTEINNNGFEIQRSTELKKDEKEPWEKIGFVKGNGTSTSAISYSFRDKNPYGGSKFVYRLKQIDFDGSYEYSTELEVELIPARYQLFQNYPNPFNPITKLKYSLPLKSQVDLVVYNTLGEEVIQLVNLEQEAGSYEVDFDATGLPSGIYFYSLQAGSFVQTKKMVLMK